MSKPLKSFPEHERLTIARRRIKDTGIGGVVARELLAEKEGLVGAALIEKVAVEAAQVLEEETLTES